VHKLANTAAILTAKILTKINLNIDVGGIYDTSKPCLLERDLCLLSGALRF
jgi:hypothetical protein